MALALTSSGNSPTLAQIILISIMDIPMTLSGNARLRTAPTYFVAALTTLSSPSILANEGEQTTEKFEQIVITASRTQASVAKAPASISVISAEQIQSKPNINLADIVKEAVGVESIKESGRAGREQVSIRGMDAKYTLVLVNGRRMSSSSAIVRGNDFDLSTIPVDSIERIEIIRGPMSALYGSDGMGGTINIITKTPQNAWQSTLNGNLSSPADGNGGEQYLLGLNTGGALINDKLYARFALNESYRNSWNPYTGTGNTSNGSYDRADVTAIEKRDTLSMQGALSWYLSDQQIIDLDLSYSDDFRDSLIEGNKGGQPSITASEQKVIRHSQALTHSGFWRWGDSQTRYSHEQVKVEGQATSEDALETNHIFESSATTYLATHSLTFGGDARYSSLDDPNNLPNSKQTSVQQQALFVQDEWAFARDWTATLGARVDHHQDFGTELSPRAYLVNQVNPNLVIKGGVGKAFKAPTMVQLNPDFTLSSCGGHCYVVGTPDLQPETSVNYELSALYHQHSWSLAATIFRNEVDNLIQRSGTQIDDGQYDRPYEYYENVEQALFQGLELEGSVELSAQLSIKANYSFTDARDATTNQQLTNRYKHSSLLQLNWKPSEHLSAFTSANYRGRKIIEQNDNGEELIQAPYTLINIGLNYQLNDSFKFRAGIDNLSNQKLSDDIIALGHVESPRTYYVGMSANF